MPIPQWDRFYLFITKNGKIHWESARWAKSKIRVMQLDNATLKIRMGYMDPDTEIAMVVKE